MKLITHSPHNWLYLPRLQAGGLQITHHESWLHSHLQDTQRTGFEHCWLPRDRQLVRHIMTPWICGLWPMTCLQKFCKILQKILFATN